MDNNLNLLPPDAPISQEKQGASDTQVPQPPQPPQLPKKKKGKGCLIAVGIFVFLMILIAIFSDGDNQAKSDSDGLVTDSTEVVTEDIEHAAAVATEEATEVVTEDIEQTAAVGIDSAKIRKLRPFFTEKKDEFKGIVWIEPKARPKYTNANGICTYFALNSEGKPGNLRFRIQYYANDWLFINSYTFLIDGNIYTFSNPDVERDNNSMIWEWSDTGVAQSGEVAQILNAIKNAKEVKIRFNGRQYYKDKVLTQKDIKAIQQPIEYFEALGGRF